jgi:hypothetical protein
MRRKPKSALQDALPQRFCDYLRRLLSTERGQDKTPHSGEILVMN